MQNSSSFNSFTELETDLNLYNQEFTRQRCSRTLSMRQYTRKINFYQTPNNNQILQPQLPLSSSHDHLIDASNFPYLDNDYILTILSQANVSQFSEILHQIHDNCSKSPRILKKMLDNEDFFDKLTEIFQNHFQNSNFPIIIQIINFIELIFPSVHQQIQSYIADSFVFSTLTDLLSTTNSLTIVIEAINLSGIISIYSSYARDLVLCSGIHTIIVDIGKRADLNSPLLEAVTQSLLSIFSNQTPIESNDLLIDFIHPLNELLEHCLSLKKIMAAHPDIFSYLQKVNSNPGNLNENPETSLNWISLSESGLVHLSAAANIIDCYVQITNKESSMVYNVFNEHIGPILISFLDDNSNILAPSALRLIGNLSVSQKHQIQESLINSGLLPRLVKHVHSPLAVDAFWCFSNLLESSTSTLLQLFLNQPEFISKVVAITAESPIDVKREASYFLSTLIIFAPTSYMSEFIEKTEIVDILVEMLGCGVISIIVRCFDCLKKLLLFCQASVHKGIGRSKSHNSSNNSSNNKFYMYSNSFSSDSLFSMGSSDIEFSDSKDPCTMFLVALFDSDLRDRIDDIIDDQKDKILSERALIVAKILDEIQESLSNSDS